MTRGCAITWFMKQKILALIIGLGAVLMPVLVLADDYGLGATAEAAAIPTNRNVTQILGDVIGSALSLVSILFFGLMLYAGIKWMLARGDSSQSEQAMGTITYAIIGLVVILASYAITNYVFENVGGTSGGPDGNLTQSEWCFVPAEGASGADGSCVKLNPAPNTSVACPNTSKPTKYPSENACLEANINP